MVGGSFAVRGFGSDLGFWAGCQRCPVFCLPPVRYGAIREALRTLSTKAIRLNASVHMPRIGAGLHDQVGWRERVFNALQRGIEFLDEIKIHALSGTVKGKIEPWRANQVEFWIVMFRTKNATDGEARRIEFFQTVKM
jgi:hypothetical protein